MRRVGRNATTALIVASQSTQALAFGGIALFLPLIRDDIDLTFSQAGSIAVASTATYTVMQIPSGYLADRFGVRRLFVVGLLGTNALSFVFALLVTYQSLMVNQAISGIFRSLIFAPGLVLITSQFREDRRATAMGLYVAGGFLSNVLLSLLGPLLVGPLGWRTLFMIFSVVAIAIVIAYWRLGAVGPSGHGRGRVDFAKLVQLLRQPVLWASGVIQFVRLALVLAVRYWLPTFLVLDRGFSLQVAGLVVAVGALTTAPATILGGYVSDRLARPLLVVGVSLTVLGVTSVLLTTVSDLWLILTVVAIQSAFIQVYFGPLFEVPIRLLGASATGTINGFSNFCANLGGLTFIFALGAVKDATGSFDVGFLSLAALCVVGLMATGFLSRLGNVQGEKEEHSHPPLGQG